MRLRGTLTVGDSGTALGVSGRAIGATGAVRTLDRGIIGSCRRSLTGGARLDRVSDRTRLAGTHTTCPTKRITTYRHLSRFITSSVRGCSIDHSIPDLRTADRLSTCLAVKTVDPELYCLRTTGTRRRRRRRLRNGGNSGRSVGH